MARKFHAFAATALAAPLMLLAATPALPRSASAGERSARRPSTTCGCPHYASCVLLGTRVKGTVKVEFNATLRAEDVLVIGNVQAENAKSVRVLDGSRRRRLGAGQAGRRGRRQRQPDRGRHPVRRQLGEAATRCATGSAAVSRRSRTWAASRSAGTRSTATCSARRTRRVPRAAATLSAATRKTNALGCDRPARSALSAGRRGSDAQARCCQHRCTGAL